jgi:hypothetical protein
VRRTGARGDGADGGRAPRGPLGNDLDLADIAFGGTTTLGYTPNNTNTGGMLSVSDGTHTANLAFLGNYMAANFAIAGDGHGGTLVTDGPPNQQQLLAVPHL